MMDYHYGNPTDTGAWNQAASIFAAHDSINSVKTSSLPLVQFWKSGSKGRVSKQVEAFLKECGLDNVEDFNNASYYFEYPVSVKEGRGKASVTDLMIISGKYALALEAKWTECNGNYEIIADWRKKVSATNGEKVLNGWIKYISDYGCDVCCSKIEEIPYQLVHRIASACAVAQNGRKAAVVYQLFYDKETKDNMREFAEKLTKSYHDFLCTRRKNILFSIVGTEVLPESFKLLSEFDGEPNSLFLEMQNRSIYKFGKTKIIF